MLIGPSYNLTNRNASVQRTVNLIPRMIEPGNEKSQWMLDDVPGLVEWADLSAEIRGGVEVNGRAFVVAGNKLYELTSAGVATERGTLASNSGRVGVTYNTTQLVVGDMVNLYVLTLATNVWGVYGYEGNGSIAFLDQYIIFAYRTGQSFGWTALGDASSIDGLDFASAEGSPDDIVGLIVDHRELILFGSNSAEVWANVGGDEVFARNSGAFIETGCASGATIQKLGGSVYWLGQSDRGQGRVYRLEGYREIPVSTQAIEERLRGIDLSGASAFTVEIGGSSLYFLNVPGVNTTLVYDAKTNQWHEWADFVDGDYTQHRATCYLRAFNTDYVGASDGKVYELDPTASDNAGDPLVRDRITPHAALPTRERVAFPPLVLDCTLGNGASVMLRYSNDGGTNFGPWLTRSVGALGKYKGRVQWSRMGSARDRVWHIRMTDAQPFNPVGSSL